MTVSLSNQHFGGSFQSSELTTFLNERESCSSKTMRWKYTSCIGAHFLRPLPCYPIGQERSTSWLLGGSNPEPSLLLKISCHFLFFFLRAAQTGLGVCVRARLASEWKRWGPSPVLPSLYLKKIPPPLRLELSGCVSCSQIYLDSSTNEIKLPLYQGLDCGEQNIILFIASQALSLILTSRSVLQPKSTSTMRAGAQVELQQTNFT